MLSVPIGLSSSYLPFNVRKSYSRYLQFAADGRSYPYLPGTITTPPFTFSCTGLSLEFVYVGLRRGEVRPFTHADFTHYFIVCVLLIDFPNEVSLVMYDFHCWKPLRYFFIGHIQSRFLSK